MNAIRNLGTLVAAVVVTQPLLLAQTYVNLSSQQSIFKDQGSRRSCICFAGTAALEAAYKRSGYGTLDLSEEFCSNVSNKMFWLHPNWNSSNGPAPRLANFTADYQENQLATTGGGSGSTVLHMLASGVRLPLESYMPYVSTNTRLQPHADYNHPHWKSQRNTNTWNLDKTRLPRKALTAPRYYSAKSQYPIASPRNPALIEGVLKTRREVVIDFLMGGYIRTGAMWTRANDSLSGLDGHSMLIVGFDRRSTNPKDWYFICKNSWGSASAMPNGFTHISYEYLQKYVTRAAYIYAVNPPQAWPELAAVGRWNLAFDGHRGTLDIYHIPGTAQAAMGHLGITDRRLGTFYDAKGVAHRVNGNIVGNRVEFWFKSKNPNMCWDEQRSTPTLGRRFAYYMMDPVRGEMAGWHQDNAGNTANPAWGGYARVPSTINGTDGYLNPVFNTTLPVNPEMHIGLWDVVFEDLKAQINIVRRNDSLLNSTQRAIYAGFEAVLIEASGKRSNFTALVAKSRPADITMTIDHSTRGRATLRGFMLSHQRGVTAGTGYYFSPTGTRGFYMSRTNSSTFPGIKSYYGNACAGTNGTPAHRISGLATLGNKISFDLTRGAVSTRAFLSLGSSNPNLDLTPMGAPGCRLFTDQLITFALTTSLTGSAGLPTAIPNDRTLIGFEMRSQFGVVDRKANAAGLTTTNGARFKVGGIR